MKTFKFKIGLSFFSVLFSLSLLAFFIPPSCFEMNLENSYLSPQKNHIFGTDENGVDVLAQVLKGSQMSFFVAFTVVTISLLIGLLLGTLSGYFEKWDPFIMRGVDMIYAFPNFLLALALLSMLGSSVSNLILVLSLSTWTTYARLVRGEILHLKKKEFVIAAHGLGTSISRKIIFHIWPNIFSLLSVQTLLTLSGVILAESGLSFLGIGVPPEVPTLGSLLQSGRYSLIEAPHLSFFPRIIFISSYFKLLPHGGRIQRTMNLGPCLMIGLKGESLTLEEKKFIENFDIGGIILFKRNARTYKGIQNLCRQIYKLKTSSPLLLAIDREGSPVDRLQDIPEFMNWKVPYPSHLSLNEISQTSFFLNQELKHLGIHMNLSPCLDLSHPQSQVLKNRTFSKKPRSSGLCRTSLDSRKFSCWSFELLKAFSRSWKCSRRLSS